MSKIFYAPSGKNSSNELVKNSQTLAKELSWFAAVCNIRIKLFFKRETPYRSIYEIPMPDISKDNSSYAQIIRHYDFGMEERIIILLALTPHVYPSVLDVFFLRNATYNRGYTEFGGIGGEHHSGFLPTGETAVFLLGGGNITKRLKALEIFKPENLLLKFNIIELGKSKPSEPKLSGALTISSEYLSYFTSGNRFKPDFSNDFPAKLINTPLDWNDLILEDYVLNEVREIEAWLRYADTIMNKWGLGKKIKPGYRALFYGPPGTGKTLTASLLGKALNLDVYRVDLSQVVSKYIGETEKNMANIFDQAENKNWILFFDEADALFGKRTATSDSKDRHANQEVAYLLQRVEDYSGVVILATNLKSNIDEAFARRFQTMIHFPMPSPEQRLRLWKSAFGKHLKLGTDVDLEEIAYDYNLAGGAIINVLRFCAIAALNRNSDTVKQTDILQGIAREFSKEGKTL